MKRLFCRTRFLFLAALLLSLLSLTAWAEESSAVLHTLHFDIALQADGSAWITETREIVFSGDRTFTRYGVNNAFTGPRTMLDWQVAIDGTPASQMAGNGIQDTLILGKTNTLQTNRYIPATDHNRDGGMSRKKKKDARLQA